MPIRLSMVKARPLITLFAFLFAMSSCKKEAQLPKTIISSQAGEIGTLTSFLSEKFKMSLEKIVFDSKCQRFVLDYNGTVSLESARKQHASANSGANNVARSFTYSMFISIARDVTVYIPASIPTAWQNAAVTAINRWNDVGCNIHITRVSSYVAGTTDIVFTSFTEPPLENLNVALGEYPAGIGVAGTTVSVNLAFNTSGRKTGAIMHALSHCFGFQNNGNTAGINIFPYIIVPSDPFSIFEAQASPWGTFTFWDYATIGKLYAKPDNGNILLYQYYSLTLTDHLYTTDESELGAGQIGIDEYQFVKPVGYISRDAGNTGTKLPLYRYYSASATDNFLTTTPSELNGNPGGYAFKGIIGYVYPTQLPGTRALHRYWNPAKKDHYYTTDVNEYGDNGSDGYERDGHPIIGYIY